MIIKQVTLGKTEKGEPIIHKVFINDLVKDAIAELSEYTAELRKESGLKELFIQRIPKKHNVIDVLAKDGYQAYNSITISSTSVNTTATTGTFTSNAGKVETTSSCVFWLTGKSGYQEFISERPTADPIKAYIKVKTENIGYGELTKTDESSGVKLSGAVYGIYSDSGCTNRVQTMTTDGNGYAKSAALVAGTYYVKEITAPKGYVLSGKVHTLTVRAGQTTGISATDKEQLGAITIYKEGEVLSSWNGSNFIYEKKKLPGATFKVTAGADIYKADGTKVYSAGDVVAERLTTGADGQVVLSDLHLGTYVVTEIKSIDGYTINTTPQTVAVEYKDQTVTVQYESATIENTRQKAEVSVVKKDSDTENPLDGGKYTLYAGNDIKNYAGQVIVTKGTALETVTTGEDGKASYSVDLPISNGYYIQETQPLENLKTLIIAVIGAVGVIILAKNVMEFAQAYQQQDSSTMNSALKGIVAGVMMAGISTVLTFLGF